MSTLPPDRTQPQKLCNAHFSSGTLKTLINRLFRLKIKKIEEILERKCHFWLFLGTFPHSRFVLFFSLSGLFISVLRVPEEKLAVHNFWGWALSGGGVHNQIKIIHHYSDCGTPSWFQLARFAPWVLRAAPADQLSSRKMGGHGILLWLAETSVKMGSVRLHPWAVHIIKIYSIGRTKQKRILFSSFFVIIFCHYKFSNDPSFETLTTLLFCVTLRSLQCHVSLLTMDTLCSQPGWHETLRRTCSIYYVLYIIFYVSYIYYIMYHMLYIHRYIIQNSQKYFTNTRRASIKSKVSNSLCSVQISIIIKYWIGVFTARVTCIESLKTS